MSASSRPTRAPESWSDAARLTATVDLPTPHLPDPTAMTCLTPGMAASWPRPLNGARTLAVIFRSTAVTPGMSETSCRASVWKRSRTGHAGVVSSKVKLTWPTWSIARSLIMPRLTTSRPRSGSLIAERTSRTSSLLGTEYHRRAHRQDPDKNQDRNHDGVKADPGHGRRAARSLHAHVSTSLDQRARHSRHRDGPQRQKREDASEGARSSDGDEEDDDQGELQDREVAVGLVQPPEAEARLRAVPYEQCQQRGRAAQARGEEQAPQRPGVAPHWLVADAQQHARVGRDEKAEDGADGIEQAVQKHRYDANPRIERGDGGEEAEHEQRPHA